MVRGRRKKKMFGVETKSLWKMGKEKKKK